MSYAFARILFLWPKTIVDQTTHDSPWTPLLRHPMAGYYVSQGSEFEVALSASHSAHCAIHNVGLMIVNNQLVIIFVHWSMLNFVERLHEVFVTLARILGPFITAAS